MALRDFVAARRIAARLLAAAVLAAALVPQLAAAAKPAKPAPSSTATDTWAATWEASPEPPRAPFVALSNQTVRQIAHVSLGGIFVRVRLSNEFGDKPLTIGAAHLGLSAGGSATQAGADRPVLFGGKPQITIPPGARALSDPISLTVPAMSDVAVSVYFPAVEGPRSPAAEARVGSDRPIPYPLSDIRNPDLAVESDHPRRSRKSECEFGVGQAGGGGGGVPP
jgi:hypothetical protein